MPNQGNLSFKSLLIRWNDASNAFDELDFSIASNSKINFNVAILAVHLRNADGAINYLTRSLACDPYLAIAYFERGSVYYFEDRVEEALEDFEDAFKALRKNPYIDYRQLGLNYVLFSCHIIYNIGLCCVVLGNVERGLRYFKLALKSLPPPSLKPDTSAIYEAIRLGEQAPDVLLPYELPEKLIFRPSEEHLQCAESVDHLGTAKVVAAIETTDTFVGFEGRKNTTLARSVRQSPTPPPIPLPPSSNQSRREKPGALKRSATTIARARGRTTDSYIHPQSLNENAPPMMPERKGSAVKVSPPCINTRRTDSPSRSKEVLRSPTDIPKEDTIFLEDNRPTLIRRAPSVRRTGSHRRGSSLSEPKRPQTSGETRERSNTLQSGSSQRSRRQEDSAPVDIHRSSSTHMSRRPSSRSKGHSRRPSGSTQVGISIDTSLHRPSNPDYPLSASSNKYNSPVVNSPFNEDARSPLDTLARNSDSKQHRRPSDTKQNLYINPSLSRSQSSRSALDSPSSPSVLTSPYNTDDISGPFGVRRSSTLARRRVLEQRRLNGDQNQATTPVTPNDLCSPFFKNMKLSDDASKPQPELSTPRSVISNSNGSRRDSASTGGYGSTGFNPSNVREEARSFSQRSSSRSRIAADPDLGSFIEESYSPHISYSSITGAIEEEASESSSSPSSSPQSTVYYNGSPLKISSRTSSKRPRRQRSSLRSSETDSRYSSASSSGSHGYNFPDILYHDDV